MKTQLFFLTFCFCFLASHLKAQTDTIYFNKDWDTCVKNKAYYTRISKKEAKFFLVKDYYPNGKLQMTGTFEIDSPTKRSGNFKHYFENGLLSSEGKYVDNKAEGLWKRYKEKGWIWMEEELHAGKNNGYRKVYFPNGSLKRKERFENGKLWEGKCYGINGKDTTFFPFEIMPSFLGGEVALYQYLAENTVYPEEASKANVSGTVKVKFMVDTDGSLKDIKIKNQGNKYLDEEAKRVVGNMPKWNPGKEDGVPVKVYFQVPIKFSLE